MKEKLSDVLEIWAAHQGFIPAEHIRKNKTVTLLLNRGLKTPTDGMNELRGRFTEITAGISPDAKKLLAGLLVFGTDAILKHFSEPSEPESSPPLETYRDAQPTPVPARSEPDILRSLEELELGYLDDLFAKFLERHWDREQVIEILLRSPPFQGFPDRVRRIISNPSSSREWEVMKADEQLAAAQVNRKNNNICEDRAFADAVNSASGKKYAVLGTMDAVSLARDVYPYQIPYDNILNWVYNEICVDRVQSALQQVISTAHGFPDLALFQSEVELALVRANEQMLLIMKALQPALGIKVKNGVETDATITPSSLEKIAKLRKKLSDEEVQQAAKDYYQKEFGAATILTLVVSCPEEPGENTFLWKLGDGRAHRISESGTVTRIDQESSRPDNMVYALFPHDFVNEFLTHIQSTEIRTEPGDKLLVHSDGISKLEGDFLTLQEGRGIAPRIAHSKNASAAAGKLQVAVELAFVDPAVNADDISYALMIGKKA